ncbi:DUF5018 domain-containing protein [Bacteroides xylanisolvens]|uniref:hypothetical protein n=1 Tax=Bacteroides xylanisolvens TaxID=371601 RepID=UPI00374FC72C
MKNIIVRINGVMLIIAFLSLIFVSCSDDEDNREYESVQIVGVKLGNKLFTPEEIAPEGETIVKVTSGMDLSNVKLQILVANGELVDFVNNVECDCRKPILVSLQGYDGSLVTTKLRIQSAPQLVSFIIKGMTIPNEDIHTSLNSIIVQVPEETDLTSLEITMEFVNGTMMNFVNGKPLDYTQPYNLNIKGVDDETIYSYQLVVTTEEVGPASIKAMTIGGLTTDAVVLKDEATLLVVPYVPGLMDFSSVDVTLETGFGNIVDPEFTGKGLNLLAGNNKVKIKGTDGIEREFTIDVPKLSLKPVFMKKYADLGLAANDLSAVTLSGNTVVTAHYSIGTKMPVYYDFAGTKIGTYKGDINSMQVGNASHGIRIVASDDNGIVLGSALGMTSGEQYIYRWDTPASEPVAYISFSQASLGTSGAPRVAGLNITGSLDGNATIVMTNAGTADIYVWTVTGGVLNNIPKKLTAPYSNSNYWSVDPLPDNNGYVGAFVGNALSGIVSLTSTLTENFKLSGISSTDCTTYKYKDRIYLAYVVHSNDKGAIMRICDITEGDVASYQNPIFDEVIPYPAANGNMSMGVDLAVVNDKLYALFGDTNVGMVLYCLEK